ncbi:ABC transporter permease [Iodidimonas nitroreducens]|uniref:ABC transporter permease n=1 Tax=Iodidimonas nitroreducens TaxID=1236968 RepID=A0A5A7NFB4_9PROT|nr:hypothetical protein [Iodidimonas nitroreducens]GAK32785.1 hypothetical protein AQ1_00658 [alpha proteobacterium Q-1]GER05666.1 ABC transporter permease [Iodidimonas nitroreducens]
MSKIKALLWRETIEHKSGMIIAPIIILALMTAMTVGTFLFGLGDIDFLNRDHGSNFGGLLNSLAEMDAPLRAGAVILFLSTMTMPALMALPIIIFFILLGALYEERRDRSFLFWKSMPVSDTAEVMTKLAGALLLAPALFIAISIVFQLLLLLLVSLIGAVEGGPVRAIWPLGAIVLNWLYTPFYMLFWALWALPIYAWVLLAGSFAPRAPFMFALVPPVVLGVIEKVLFDSYYLARWVGQHFAASPMMEAIVGSSFAKKAGAMTDSDMPAFVRFLSAPDFAPLFNSLAQADLWLGLVISAAFIYGAIWFRRYSI